MPVSLSSYHLHTGILAQLAPSASQSQPDATTWILIAAGAALLVYLMLRSRAKKRADPLSDPLRLTAAQQKHIERDMQNLVVELHEMARQISAQLDTRARRLQELLDLADQKIDQMQNAKPLQNGQSLSGSASPQIQSARKPAGQRAAHLSLVRDDAADDEPLASEGTDQEPLTPTHTTDDDLERLGFASPNPQTAKDHADVYALADRGLSVIDISRKLDRMPGEVELILALRKRSG